MGYESSTDRLIAVLKTLPTDHAMSFIMGTGQAKKKSEDNYEQLELYQKDGDAFRHVYWNAHLTICIGEYWTEKATTLYEDLSEGQSNIDRQMDLFNNAKGRELGNKLKVKFQKYFADSSSGEPQLYLNDAGCDALVPYVKEYVANGECKKIENGKLVSTGDGLKLGDTGSAVIGIQEMLLDLGYLTSPSQVDGSFGPITLDAVKAFQDNINVPVTGIVDNYTRGRLADYTRLLAQSIASEITKTGLFKDLNIQAYMIEDKEYTLYDTLQLTVKAKFSMFPTQGTSDMSLDMTNTNSASGTLYSGALSVDGSLNINEGKIKTALDTIGVKIGAINGGDLRIKLVNNPSPNEFTMLLEYCKTIAGHNVYQILEITFRNMGQQTTQTAPAYATEMKETFDVDIKDVLVAAFVIGLTGVIILSSGGSLSPVIPILGKVAVSLH